MLGWNRWRARRRHRGICDFLPFLLEDRASKANILIDPLELQATTLDDLDEDEEPAPAAAQVPR